MVAGYLHATRFPSLLFAAIFFSSTFANAVTLDQDQGVLKVRFAKSKKPFEYSISNPKDCPADSIQVKAEGEKISVRHLKRCSSGATLNLTVANDQKLSASLDTGAIHLTDFSAQKDQVGNILIEAEVGTVNVPDSFGFKSIGKSYSGRTLKRDGKASAPEIVMKVKNGVISVD